VVWGGGATRARGRAAFSTRRRGACVGARWLEVGIANLPGLLELTATALSHGGTSVRVATTAAPRATLSVRCRPAAREPRGLNCAGPGWSARAGRWAVDKRWWLVGSPGAPGALDVHVPRRAVSRSDHAFTRTRARAPLFRFSVCSCAIHDPLG